MDPKQLELAVKYLLDKLGPDEKDEVQQLLGGGDMPDLGEDALQGRLAMDRLPARIKRRAIAGLSQDRKAADVEAFAKRYPGAMRVKA